MSPELPERLELINVDETFARRFEALSAQLRAILGPDVPIEHIASTSVPTMVAKPVIDVLIVSDTAPVLEKRAELAALGFEHRTNAWPDVERHAFFRRFTDGIRTEHLHVVPPEAVEVADYLAVKDLLRSDPAEAAAYSEHKLELWRRHGDDRAAYVAAKPAYVEALVGRARSFRVR